MCISVNVCMCVCVYVCILCMVYMCVCYVYICTYMHTDIYVNMQCVLCVVCAYVILSFVH